MTGPVRKYLDLFAGEKSGLGVRQDGWYKFCYGWLNGKESCLVEDPNVYIRGVNTDIKNGINDRFILFMMEPYAHGLTMSFPYGSWLQNQVKDAFWPDMRLVKQLGTWLDEHDYLFPKNPAADIAVIYDQPSAYENMMTEPSRPAPIAPGTLDLTGVTELGRIGGGAPSGNFRHFFDIIQKLCDKAVLYNVLYQCEDDPMSAQRLAAYKTVILPDAFLARSEDVEVLHDFAARGGKIFTLGRCPKGLEDVAQPAADCEEILCRIGEDKGPVVVPESDGYGIALHKTEKGYVLNLVNYNYNEETHRIDPLDVVPCKLSFAPKALRAHAFPKNENLCVKLDGQNLEIQNAGIFTGIELEL